MADTYSETRDRIGDYFDRAALRQWEALTSDAPVSRIRATVRAGRERMRALLLAAMPADLRGAQVLDAGCGTGAMAEALARRGATVTAVDLSPRLLAVAAERIAPALRPRIRLVAGDMGDPGLGRFDLAVAMDSLIHYRAADMARGLARLAAMTDGRLLFTVAPRTPLLALMHLAGGLFPRGDRAPAIVPLGAAALARAIAGEPGLAGRQLRDLGRVATGFYISAARELRP